MPPTGVCVPLGKPSRNESLRRIIASLPAEAGVAPPVNASSLGVETPLMLTPERDKAVVRAHIWTLDIVVCEGVRSCTRM